MFRRDRSARERDREIAVPVLRRQFATRLVPAELREPDHFGTTITSREERGLGVAWFRFLLNGSTIESYISADGVAWKQMHTAHALTASFTTAPDQWGFWLNNQSGLPCWLDVIDWDE